MNHYLIHDTPIGELVLNSNRDFLLSISFKDNLLFQHNRPCLSGKNLVLEKAVKQLDEYFFHNHTLFTIKYIL